MQELFKHHTVSFEEWVSDYVLFLPEYRIRNLALVGQSEGDKSLIVKSLVRRSIEEGTKVFVLDATGQYHGGRDCPGIQSVAVRANATLGLDPVKALDPYVLAEILVELAGLNGSDAYADLGTRASSVSTLGEFLEMVPARYGDAIHSLMSPFTNGFADGEFGFEGGIFTMEHQNHAIGNPDVLVLFLLLVSAWKAALATPGKTMIIINDGWIFTNHVFSARFLKAAMKQAVEQEHDIQFVVAVPMVDYLLPMELMLHVNDVLSFDGKTWISMMPTKEEVTMAVKPGNTLVVARAGVKIVSA